MKRRSLLKGAAASAAARSLGPRWTGSTSAQTPLYDVVDVYTFTADPSGNLGGFSGLSDSGIIAGYDYVDDLPVPAIWDADGNRIVLDTLGVPYTECSWVHINGAGVMSAVLIDGSVSARPFETIVWEDPRKEGVVFGSHAFVECISPRGNMSGQVKHVPARWIDGEQTFLDIPDGQHSGIVSNINDAGDSIVLFENEADVVSHPPVVWLADGAVQQLEWPDEVAEFGNVESFGPSVPAIFDNGDFVLDLRVEGTGASGRYAWIYRAGIPELLPGTSQASVTTVRGAIDDRFMVGGPDIWIGGTVYPFKTLLSDTAGFSTDHVAAVNTEREIAGIGLHEESGAYHGLLFRPMS